MANPESKPLRLMFHPTDCKWSASLDCDQPLLANAANLRPDDVEMRVSFHC